MPEIEDFYQSLELVQLKDLVAEFSEEKIHKLLKTYKCTKNSDLELFLHDKDKAINLEKKHITRTYIYIGEHLGNISVLAYFSIALKIFPTIDISKTLVKKLDGISKKREYLPCFLIAQLGKHSDIRFKIGQHILDEAIDTIKVINLSIGGRFIILDSVNNENVIKFYTEEPNSFTLLVEKEASVNLPMYYPLF